MTVSFQFLRDFELTFGDVRINIHPLSVRNKNASKGPKNDTATSRPETPIGNILRVRFKCDMSASDRPNACQLEVFNLSRNNRSRIVQGENNIDVGIKAGYVNVLRQLFIGRSYEIFHARRGTDWVTNMRLLDGLQFFNAEPISLTFPPGTTVKQVILQLAREIDPSDSARLATSIQSKLSARDKTKSSFVDFERGFSLQGNATKTLFAFLRGVGLKGSIQQGKLEILGDKETFGAVIPVNEKVGMIGSPEVGLGGRIKVRTLLNADLRPNRTVLIDSTNISKGRYNILEASHTGDTWGSDWYSDLIIKRIV